jgi:hypothetical protein
MVTFVPAARLIVVMLNVADFAPAGTVTLAGTVAAAFELLKFTTTPLDGAGTFRCTLFDVDVTLPTSVAGDRVSADSADKATGLTVKIDVLVTPPQAADTVTLVATATLVVVIVNIADVAPAGTVTLAGTTALAFELRRVTTAPLDGAGAFKETVAIEATPEATEAGLSESELNTAGLIVNAADATEPDNVAVSTTFCCGAATAVVAVNVALVAPAATVTEGGTAAYALFVESRTAVELAGARLSVTVQVELPPALIVEAEHVRDEISVTF